ncbi:MAG: hypothetical protein CFE45_07080 [Burkholderiales bacterium PBB5]|nr:MAG: hypothetical protein CFE45_07080 [Burkholderiales bacterium PBB5]
MADDLRRNVVRALGTSSVISVLTKVLSLAATLVLARLLSPADFGLVAIATTVTGVVGFFNEIGLGSAIVQRPQVAEDEINGCFGIAMLASSALCLITLALSWPMAGYYRMPALQPVLMALSFSLYFGAFNTVPLALLRKSLRFQPVLWCSALAVVVQACVSIPLAAAGARHWAIVTGFLVGQTAATGCYWWASGWRPRWPMNLRQGRVLMGYGLNITYTRVLWHVYMNADKLIIGKLLGPHAVGIYDVGKSLANLPTSQISGVATNIASPVYARLQDDLLRLREAMLHLVRGVSYLTFPLLMGMAVLADDLIMTLMGPAWRDAVWPLRALCLSEAVASIANLQTQLLISSGNVKRLIRYNSVCALVLPAALALAAWQAGLNGVALAWAVVYPVLYTWLLREVLRVTDLRLIDWLRALGGPARATAVMVLVLLALQPVLAGQWFPAARLAVGAVVGALVYGACVVWTDARGLSEIRQVLTDLGVPAARLAGWPFSRLDKVVGVQGG